MKQLLLISLLFCGLQSCETSNKDINIDYNEIKEPLINANKASISTETKQINAYIKRRKWKMETTGTGLRYMIYKKGFGQQAQTNMLAVINYSVGLINGETVYETSLLKPEQFVIGKGDVESGLQEVLTYLRVGDKVKIIIPSHLAFGLTGDRNKIPSKATLIYDLELLNLKSIN